MAKVYKDLREFLKTLEEEGQLIRVKDEVDPENLILALPDVPALIWIKNRLFCLRR